MRIVSIVGSVPASISMRIISVYFVEVIGLILLSLVFISFDLIAGLVVAMGVVAVV